MTHKPFKFSRLQVGIKKQKLVIMILKSTQWPTLYNNTITNLLFWMFEVCSPPRLCMEFPSDLAWSSHLGSVQEASLAQLGLKLSWRWWQPYHWDQSFRQNLIFCCHPWYVLKNPKWMQAHRNKTIICNVFPKHPSLAR